MEIYWKCFYAISVILESLLAGNFVRLDSNLIERIFAVIIFDADSRSESSIDLYEAILILKWIVKYVREVKDKPWETIYNLNTLKPLISILLNLSMKS